LVVVVLIRHLSNAPLQYFCSKCNTLLKETYESADNRLLANPAEECPTCGSLLSESMKRELKPEQKQQQEQQQNSIQQSRSSLMPKFQTAYEEFDSRLTLDIKKIDDSISLRIGECLCIIGERKYTKIALARLCVRALLPKRHSGDGNGFESSNVIVIDAGNSLDIYQHVNFARQYGLDIKKVLQRIIISRVFTIYQLANIIINELPTVIQQYDDTKLFIVIYDLLDMFLRDPQLEVEEGQRIIKEIINSIRRRREIFGNTLTVTSLSLSSPSSYGNYCHYRSSSAEYYKILLPRFDKHIEIITTTKSADNNKKISTTSLEGKLKDNSKYRLHSKRCDNNNSSTCVFPIEERDLLLVTPR
jgi:DNA-directed RNA polymerase subunit M/transcription elongation factor TFIIS